MTTVVERTIYVDAPLQSVWDFISDPRKRAESISVVSDHEPDPHDETIHLWRLKLPIPFVSETITVETQEIERDPPRFVHFAGKGPMLRVDGRQTLSETDSGTRIDNHFTVDSSVPGVERFFKRNLNREFANIEAALERENSRNTS